MSIERLTDSWTRDKTGLVLLRTQRCISLSESERGEVGVSEESADGVYWTLKQQYLGLPRTREARVLLDCNLGSKWKFSQRPTSPGSCAKRSTI